MRHYNDVLWKGVLPWVFDDLLRFVFPDADEVFDFDKQYMFLDKELQAIEIEIDNVTGVKAVDSLVQVFRKDGQEEWVLVHLEIQDNTKAESRALFPERMFRYFYRCFNGHNRPVAAIAIFTGHDGRLLEDCYCYEFMGTKLSYSYNVLRILDYKDEDLMNSENPFAWVALAAKYALLRGANLDQRLLAGKLFIFRKLYENGLFEREKMQAVFEFVDRALEFKNSETNSIFMNEIDQITHKKNAMVDIFQVSKDIAVERRLEGVIKNLLLNTTLSVQEIARSFEVSEDFVNEIVEDLKNK